MSLSPMSSVLDERNGMVLGKDTILKNDHYRHARWSTGNNRGHPFVSISGAPNFRGSDLTNVYAVAQPTSYGLRALLNHIKRKKAASGVDVNGLHSNTLLINLREEPHVFINRRTYVLRDSHQPFLNLRAYSGITAERIEDMEWRLKVDGNATPPCMFILHFTLACF